MAGESLEPGMGSNSKLERRIAKIERFIGRFKIVNIFANSQFGRQRKYEVLAREGRFKEEEGTGIYDVSLITRDSKYFVTVTHGWVRDMKTGEGDALAYLEAKNHYEEAEPPTNPKTYTEKLAEFPIEIEQAVYITTNVDENGQVNSGASPEATDEEKNPVTIEIAEDNKESVQYQPKVDDQTSGGVAGVLRFKLAVLEAPEKEGEKPKLKHYLSGDHIHYAPPLPSIKSTLKTSTDVAVIPEQWSNSENAYKLRAIKGMCGIGVEQSSGSIDIKPKGNTFKVRLWHSVISTDYLGSIEIDNGPSPAQEFWVLKGIWYSTEPDTWSECGGEDRAPVHDISYVIPTVAYS